jgi:O-antigen/teichoic acid export membrane protein
LLNTLFGPEYVAAAAAFRLLILSIGFIFIYGVIHNVLLVCDRMRIETWIMGSGVALNIGLNLILIPRYGLVGAAFATALAEGLILLLGFYAIYKINIVLDLRPVLRSLLAAGIMGTALLALGPGRGLVLYIGVGFIVYVLALSALRGIPQDSQPHLRKLSLFCRQIAQKISGSVTL